MWAEKLEEDFHWNKLFWVAGGGEVEIEAGRINRFRMQSDMFSGGRGIKGYD